VIFEVIWLLMKKDLKNIPARDGCADNLSYDEPESGRRVIDRRRVRGRGASSNVDGRFEAYHREQFDNGWGDGEDLPPFQTEVRHETAKSIIATNKSPDIAFDQSINPYRGCEHGCSYCYARPSHAFWGLSPGLDFETKLTAKVNAVEMLEKALSNPSYKVSPIALGANTDPYQPIERGYKLTRQLLEVLERTRHPVTIVTKSALVLRDLDILSEMAALGLCKVALSITSLDAGLSRKMEPRASAPHKRLAALATLRDAGVPTMVMVAPVIPGLNDHEIEGILEAVSKAGAGEAGYVLLRLPLEIKTLFREWLEEAVPDRAGRVISLLQSMHGGEDYRSEFGVRQRGEGPFADLIAQRFQLARRRYGIVPGQETLRCDLFKAPTLKGGQMSLF
jgi:DNA repair photolyase